MQPLLYEDWIFLFHNSYVFFAKILDIFYRGSYHKIVKVILCYISDKRKGAMREKLLPNVVIVIFRLIILALLNPASAYTRTCYPAGSVCSYCVPCVISPGVPGAEPYAGMCIGAPGLSGAGSCDGYQVGPCIAGC